MNRSPLPQAIACAFLVAPLVLVPGCHRSSSRATPVVPDGGRLLLDIHSGLENPSSSPSRAVRLGDFHIFTARVQEAGQELWRSDGTAAGTTMVADVVPGPGSSNPRDLVVAGGLLYFTAANSLGRELWRTDGTAAGTAIVADLRPGAPASQPTGLVEFAGELYFAATTAFHGEELWRVSGGVPQLVADLDEGVGGGPGTVRSSSPRDLTAFRGALYFTAWTRVHGRELWRTDGSPGGTRLVADLLAGPQGSDPFQLTVFGTDLFFTAAADVGAELYVSDGSAVRLAADVAPGPPGSAPAELVGSELGLFFRANGPLGTELYVFDGLSGARLVKDIHTSGHSLPTDIVSMGRSVLFRANDGHHGPELWVSNGRPEGTFMLLDGFPGQQGSVPGPVWITGAGGHGFFAATDPAHGTELWVTDGTAAGTRLAADLFAGEDSSGPVPLAVIGDGILLSADDGVVGREPWFLSLGRREVFDLAPSESGSSAVEDFFRLGPVIYFAADDGVHGRELWRTANGVTGLVKDLAPGRQGSDPRHFVELGGLAYFLARDPLGQPNLWVTDGTEPGTNMLLRPQDAYVVDAPLVKLDESRLVLAVHIKPGSVAPSLWVTDGTLDGTQLISAALAGYTDPVPHGGNVYFVGGGRLHVTDGTAAGSRILLATALGEPATNVFHLTPVGSHLFFSARTDSLGNELWSSGGTPETTGLVKDLVPGADGGWPDAITAFQGRAFFRARASTGPGVALWSSDGTETGTARVLEFVEMGDRLMVHGDKLYFAAQAGDEGMELWVTDGTAVGTRLVDDIHPGSTGSEPLVVGWRGPAPSRLLFLATDGARGRELWSLDGDGRPFLMREMRPGISDGFSRDANLLVIDGSTILLPANDGVHGNEPWLLRTDVLDP